MLMMGGAMEVVLVDVDYYSSYISRMLPAW